MPDENSQRQLDIAWDDEAIIRAAGRTPEAVQATLKNHQQKVPSSYAVYQWWSRRKIPDTWRPRLIYALLRDQKIVTGKLFRVGSGRRRSN